MNDHLGWFSPTVAPGNAPSQPAARPAGALPGMPSRVAPAFRWSWKLTTVAGIDLCVHGTVVLLIAFVAFSGLIAARSAAALVSRTLLILAVFTTVVLHDVGHALTARRFGVRTRNIALLPIGGVARLENLPDKPTQQLLAALAGPAVNLVMARLLFRLVRALNQPIGIARVVHGGGPFLTQLMWTNASVAGFNLLPGYPMDGEPAGDGAGVSADGVISLTALKPPQILLLDVGELQRGFLGNELTWSGAIALQGRGGTCWGSE